MPEEQAFRRFISPNRYQLSGGGIHVTYLTVCGPVTPGGGGCLSYHDSHRALNFRGDEIRVIEVPDLGTWVSVTLHLTVDFGSTTFSVLLPHVNVPDMLGACEPVHTQGITTIHRTSIIPQLIQGQLDIYTVTPLSGTACNVIVPL